MPFSILNPLEHPDWDALLATNGQTTFFHTAAWARVLADSYGYRPLYFSAIEAGRLAGLIPVMAIASRLTGRRGVALPFTDLCHPVARDAEVFQELFAAAADHGRKAGWRYLEIRGGGGFLDGRPAAARHLVHTLELGPGEAAVRKGFRSSTLRNIRKAEKEGVSVSMECSRAAMAAYYRLHCGTRRYQGLPPQPWVFFENIRDHVVAAGKGFVALAAHAGRTVAGAVFAVFRGEAIYKFGASERAAQHLRPNNLLMWAAIRRACGEGLTRFHFGRTEPGNEGLLQFKRSWGPAEEALDYFRFDLRANAFAAGAAAPKSSYAFFKLMPVPLLRLAGELLYRHVG